MTSVDAPIVTGPRNRGRTRPAAWLFVACLVLVLLAIEQRQAAGAWSALRDDVGPAIGKAAGWAFDGGPGGLSGLRDTVRPVDGSLAAGAGDQLLSGEFDPVDAATRQAVGTVTFVGASIRLERGDTFRTQPLRIASGREAFVSGQTFSRRLATTPDAQIELRRIVPVNAREPVPPSSLCGGDVPGVVAVLHRRGRVDMMLFRDRTIVGPDAPVAGLCGIWHFRAR